MKLSKHIKQYFVISLVLIGVVACAPAEQKTVSGIVVSKNDSREYRYLTLENGLKVMLVSDPKTDYAAASMDVYVGSSADPQNRQGLAHFLEHMLFLGTAKYPQADEYMRFLEDNGGSNNAYTSFEHTNYFFDVKPSAFPEALDRFSQFFIAPLLDERYVEREKHAVDSEYQAGIKEDSRRAMDVLREVMNPEHPFSKFSVGSLQTLSSEKTPIKKDLMAFYQQHYVANNMALTVLSAQSLDDLEKEVRTRFFAIPVQPVKHDVITASLFRSTDLPKIIQIKPEKKLRELQLFFPIADQDEYYRTKPVDVVANVLGNEGKGSLLAYLKQRNLAESLSASQALNYHGGTLFSISISLTEQGVVEQEQVLALVFQAIKRLQEVNWDKRYFKEIALINQMDFDFKAPERPQSYVLGIANNLHYYPASDVLRADYLMDTYRPELIRKVIEALTINNCLIIEVNSDVQGQKKSNFYQAPYTVKAVDSALVKKLSEMEVNADILLPEKNNYLPDDFSLVKSVSDKKPELLVNKPGVKLWYKPVDHFRLPKAASYFSFRKENVRKTAHDAVLMDTYIALLNDGFSEWSYPAQMASLSFQFYTHVRGVALKIDGFSDKQDELLNKALQEVKVANITDAQFQRVKATIIKNLKNVYLQQPYRRLEMAWGEEIQKPSWPVADRLVVLEALTLKDIQYFSKSFWQDMDILAMINGNIGKQQALDMMGAVEGFVQHPQVVKAPISILRIPRENVMQTVSVQHKDSGYLLYWQAKRHDDDANAKYMLLAKALESPFFNDLRTEQQLGYVVYARYTPALTVPGIMFVVQSPVASVEKINIAMQQFLEASKEPLMTMKEEYLQQLKAALRQELLAKPLSLVEESNNYWLDLSASYSGMDRNEQLARAIDDLSVEDWQAFIRRIFQSPLSRMLLLTTPAALLPEFLPKDAQGEKDTFVTFPIL